MRETAGSASRDVEPITRQIHEPIASEQGSFIDRRRVFSALDSPAENKIIKYAGDKPRTDLAPVGRAQLIVCSPVHSQVRTSGFGSFFRAGAIHVEDSAGVVSASKCRLTKYDHYHVRRASVSMEPLHHLSAAAREALAQLRDDPSDSAAIRRFQQTLRPLASKEPSKGSPEASRQVAATRRVTIEDCADVQTGDGSVMCTTSKYVAEVTDLPLVDLLVEDRKLVQAFARAVHEPESGGATSSFYRCVARAAGQVDELTRLAQAPDLQQVPDTGLFSFFGFASVHDATGVMIGWGNELKMRTTIDLPSPDKTAVLRDINELRREEGPSIEVTSDPSQPFDGPDMSRRRGRSL